MPETLDIRHRKAVKSNIPSVGSVGYGNVPPAPRIRFSPHRTPTLRFRHREEILTDVREIPSFEKLSIEEQNALLHYIEQLKQGQPWLEWSEKRDLPTFTVDPVVLQTHERVSAQAILSVATTKKAQLSMFGDDELTPAQKPEFYSHKVGWTNRLILGDSLQVMASLSARESEVAGQVQMIYLDPPYGIKFASNFQPQIGQRNVIEGKDADLTREPEMVRAFRDTWHLGIHSYLTYLRDRLTVARELLHHSGSIFVQISDENLHRVRALMDEVFGTENFVSQITFTKTSSSTSLTLSTTSDYLLWYSKDIENIKYRKLFNETSPGEVGATEYNRVELRNGELCGISRFIEDGVVVLPDGARIFATDSIVSAGGNDPDIEFGDGSSRVVLSCKPNRHWKPGVEGIKKLWMAEKLLPQSGLRIYKRYFDNFSLRGLTHVWTDTRGENDMSYVVQTHPKVIERCLLMTTDPGDLVLDPTCGSGTTAYVAEQWGRRWISIDTSRVALAIARQRLLTARFDHYKFKDEVEGVSGGFICKSVPHITLKSIAQNPHLDPIFDKHAPTLDAALTAANAALNVVDANLRRQLKEKLAHKQKIQGKKSVTDADRRRWELPARFEFWTMPFDTDTDWPKELQDAVNTYRKAWRARMDEVDALIRAHAETEELVDQPEVVKGIVRVSGPFTVEAVLARPISYGEETFMGFDGEPDEMETGFKVSEAFLQNSLETENPEAYITNLINLLKTSGVTFPDNRELVFSRLDPTHYPSVAIHAEGRCHSKGEADSITNGISNVAVCFGPQYGSLTVSEIQDVRRFAINEGYEHVIFAGFSFDAAATAEIERKLGRARFETHMAHIRPDVNPVMGDLLKDSQRDQLFSVFGAPRVRLEKLAAGEFRVHMEGVDIYDPTKNEVIPARADKIAAWFLDADYNDEVFSITQAFFPDKTAWDKLERALKGTFTPDVWDTLSGTTSLPFVANGNRKIAVKVIDPRGNEVMKVVAL